MECLSRRACLGAIGGSLLCGTAKSGTRRANMRPAQIAITLDLEMSRNFPNWEDTHWDYEKGNLNDQTKKYAVDVCRRVRARGGRVHNFVVGRVLEQENVEWLREISEAGHPLGNHTYDHVYLLAKTKEDVQFRFRRAPWLLKDAPLAEILRENIDLATRALKSRLGIAVEGFRTPGGFSTGLHGRPDIQQMLLDLGFSWVSSMYPRGAPVTSLGESGGSPDEAIFSKVVAVQAAAQPFIYPSGLIEIPMSPLSDITAFRGGRWQLKDFLRAIRLAVEWTIDHGGVFDFLAHPSCLGVVDPKFETVDMICALVEESRGKAQIVTLDEIAAKYKSS